MKASSPAHFAASVSGATAVEFALIIGPLLLLLAGTVEFSRLLWTREALQSIAIAGARCMGVAGTDCAIKGVYDAAAATSYVVSQGTTMRVPLTDKDVTLNPAATCAGVSGFSEVSISYTFHTAIPSKLVGMGDGISLSATACFPNQP
jgi:Flp pilus assembly protein TadG